ncbi:glycosyltransferase [Bradymonadaceae bacterium TMQ3]|nr:glycosyltransferase [Bradymonadaceae bacterium TMQ3]TXC77276.1 glycosyltransferase family 4 protein [Bradymonadales bacterium TMQ1]
MIHESMFSRQQVYPAVFVGRSSAEIARRYSQRFKRLADAGFEIHVLAADDGGFDALRRQGVQCKAIPVASPRNAAALMGAYFIVQGVMLELRPVLVHIFSHRLAWLSAFAARQAEVPALFVTLEYHWLEEEPVHLPLGPMALVTSNEGVRAAEERINAVVGYPWRKVMLQAYERLGTQVDRYVVTTEFDFRLLQDLGLVAPSRLEVAVGGVGVDVTRYRPASGDQDEARQRAREALGLPTHWRQVVGWVGPVSRRHGADDLVATVKALRRTHPSLGWVIAPRGTLADGQARRLRRLADRGWVRLVHGERKTDANFYQALDVMACFGTTSTPIDGVLEAGACGVPTVAYNTPATRSLIVSGSTGELVLEGDQPTLTSVLSARLRAPELLRGQGAKMRERVETFFRRESSDDQMLQLYDAVLGAKLVTS